MVNLPMGRSRLTVKPENAGKRLDIFLSEQFPHLTRSRIKKLIENGDIKIDGCLVKAGTSLKPGNTIIVNIPSPEPPGTFPQSIPLSILHEDGDLIVIDKSPHMVVHPAHGHPSGTLVNALLHHCRDLSGIGGVTRPGIVHRLDKGTSGVMVAAKNDAAHNALAKQFKDHTIGRVYLAAVKGEVAADEGLIEGPLSRHHRDRKRITVREGGRRAVTRYQVLGRRRGISLVRLTPATGRTHQLRVHLASIGHPVLGDATYGGTARSIHLGNNEVTSLLRTLKRPALHALKLEFDHPSTGKRLAFEAPPPDDLAGLFSWIEGKVI
jgi:23S rRNA pseudouridine1911/1915/1917 synthase